MALPGYAGKAQVFPERMKSLEWQKLFLNTYPNEFCKQGDYFYECYIPNREQCLRLVKPLTFNCLKSSKIPKIVQWPEEGMELGRNVGACVAKTFLTQFKGKRRDLVKCRNDKQW